MHLMHFHQLRAGLQNNAPPASEPALTDRAELLRGLLTGSGLFVTVEAEHTGDPDRLLAGLCTFRQAAAEEDVAAGVERLWLDWLCYPFWEVHSTYVDANHVEFEGATRESVLGHYVTVHLVCQRAPVPAQRAPEAAG